MTLMILFLSEIIPKTIGAVYWRSLAGVTARFVRLLIVVLYPLIWISEILTRLVAGGKQAHVFSREEFIAMAGVGERSGKIDPHESRIIRNLLRLGSLTARDIMTPRTVISALPQTMTVAEAMAVEPAVTFSRLPIHTKGLDYVTGFILRDDLLLASSDNRGDRTLDSLKREIYAVPGNISLTNLFDYMLDRRQHIALVVDEHGGTQGLVTTEDVLETILGLEIVDETDRVADMQVLARQQWRQRAAAMGVDLPEDDPAPKLD
jgi:CBS domain containing-hemolysin-like protein